MARIGMIGAGSWGTALSKVLADNQHEVLVWSIIEDEIRMALDELEEDDSKNAAAAASAAHDDSWTKEVEEALADKA